MSEMGCVQRNASHLFIYEIAKIYQMKLWKEYKNKMRD